MGEIADFEDEPKDYGTADGSAEVSAEGSTEDSDTGSETEEIFDPADFTPTQVLNALALRLGTRLVEARVGHTAVPAAATEDSSWDDSESHGIYPDYHDTKLTNFEMPDELIRTRMKRNDNINISFIRRKRRLQQFGPDEDLAGSVEQETEPSLFQTILDSEAIIKLQELTPAEFGKLVAGLIEHHERQREAQRFAGYAGLQ